MQQKASSLVFVRSERLGRKYVLYSQSFELVVFAFVYCVSHSAQMSLSITALEKHLCPQGWPPGRLGSLRVWRNGYWLSSIGKQQVYRAPADFLESSCPSCTAVSHWMLLGTDTRQKDFGGIYSSFPVKQSITFEEECLIL